MKINERHLCELSTLCTPADKRGYLNKLGEVDRTFQRRWFVLRGNLLFYFEGPDDSEPTGVIVLENCVVSVSEHEDRYAFELSFGGSGTRTYVLAADSQKEMEDWMRVLSRSSCSYLQTMIGLLQLQVADLDASSATKPTAVTETVTSDPQTSALTDEIRNSSGDLDSSATQHSLDATAEQTATANVVNMS